MSNLNFSPQAAQRWQELDEQLRERLMNNVWCGSCGDQRTIESFSGHVESGDLILEGRCARCGGAVARLIEFE